MKIPSKAEKLHNN